MTVTTSSFCNGYKVLEQQVTEHIHIYVGKRKTNDEPKEVTVAQAMKKCREGYWEAMQDIVANRHIEFRNTQTGKRFTVMVRDFKAKDGRDDTSVLKKARQDLEKIYRDLNSFNSSNKSAESKVDEATSEIARAQGSLKKAIDYIEFS